MDKDNTGVLFKVEDKKSENHPDMTGTIILNGKKMSLASWFNVSKDGTKKYMSLKVSEFKPKESSTSSTPQPKFEDSVPF